MSFRDRLRPAEFIAPSGVSMKFYMNEMSRESGKKGGVAEVLDSDYSVMQDQGRTVYKYPVKAYFTGQDYDKDIDRFVELLEERYTRSFPGTLKHPRWGNLDVAPIGGWKQDENIVDGSMVGYLEINFIEVSQILSPAFLLDALKKLNAVLTAINRASTLVARAMDIRNSALASGIIGAYRNATTLIAGTIANVGRSIDNIEESITEIEDEIETGLDDIANSIESTTESIQRLTRLASDSEETSATSSSATSDYTEMTESLMPVFNVVSETNVSARRNNAMMFEMVAGFSVAATAEVAAGTSFTTASDSILAIDLLFNLLDTYQINLAQTRTDGNATQEYSGDHNLYLLVCQAVQLAIAYILSNAFDLKKEKRYVLKNPSDVLTECYKAYKNVQPQTVNYFLTTNKISDYNGEFSELGAGRELVVYV